MKYYLFSLQATLSINVTDVNDNRPIFTIPPEGLQGSVFERAPLGFEVLTVVATDLDTGGSQFITYFIDTNITGVSVPFAIPDPTVSFVYIMTVMNSMLLDQGMSTIAIKCPEHPMT